MANIFQQYLTPPKSVMEYSADMDAADQRRNALQMSALGVQQAQANLANAADLNSQRNALRAAVTAGQVDLSNPDHVGRALAIAPDVAPALLKTVQDSATARATAGKALAETDETKQKTAAGEYDLRIKKSDQAIKDIAGFNSPQEALASLQAHVAAGDVDPAKAELIRQGMPQDPTKFSDWKVGMIRNIMSAKEQMQYSTPDANTVANNERIRSEGDANRVVQKRGQDMADARSDMTLTHGIKGLTPEQNDALFGENGAVTTGRLDPNRLNSRTAGIFADAELKRPGTDFSKISGDIALGRNATFRQRAMTAETLPEVMQNMVDAGKKVGFSDNRTIGKMQAWTKGEFNDPDMTAYMTMRNDALMTVAQVMRGAGMTDMAHRAETEAAAPTMSPAALDAWLKAQMTALQPRLDQNRRITRDVPASPASPAATQPVRKYNPATGRIE